MKIFVLNPPFVKDFCRSARWAARSRGRVQRHPDALLTLVAHLQKHGHELGFLDGPVSNLDRQGIKELLKNFAPQMFILHTTTPSIYSDLEYAQDVKRILPECLTVALGAHVTALTEETFKFAAAKYENSLDAIAVGEFEFSLAELAGTPEKIAEIPGIASFKDQKLCFQRRKNGNLNELPFPAWNLIKPEDYRDGGKRFPFLTLINARGCIGSCIFCRDHSSIGAGALRQRSPELVIEEMEYDLQLFPQIQEIMFETDSFTAIRSYTEALCRLMIKKGLNKRITWSCNTRVDMDLELLPLMKEAGCRMLMTGFEFGTQAALDAVKKGVTLEQSVKFAQAANRLGFTIHGCFMIGAPGETEESAKKTIEFAKSLPCDTVQFSGLCPYPGTELYEWAKTNGFLIPRDWTEWVDENHEQCTLLSYPQLPKERIDYYIDRGLKEFFLRPRQIAKMIFNIRSFSDIRRKLYGLKSFLDYFGSKK